MLPVTKVVVFISFARFPRFLANNRGKVIDQRDTNPCKKGNGQAEDVNWMVVGSNPGAGKRFFLVKSMLKNTGTLILLWNLCNKHVSDVYCINCLECTFGRCTGIRIK